MNRRRKNSPLRVGCGILLSAIFLAGPNQISTHAVAKPKMHYSFKMTKPVESDKLVFRDELVDLAFGVERKKITLSLTNNTQDLIRINWNEVSYIDPFGQSHELLHLQSPVSLPPTAKITMALIPKDYIYSSITGKFARFDQREFFPKPDKKEAHQYKGKAFSVFVPIEVKGTAKTYLLTFSIDIAERVEA